MRVSRTRKPQTLSFAVLQVSWLVQLTYNRLPLHSHSPVTRTLTPVFEGRGQGWTVLALGTES